MNTTIKTDTEYLLYLCANVESDTAQVGFKYNGEIKYINFEPSAEVKGLMEGLAALIFQRPLDMAKVLTEFEIRRVKELTDHKNIDAALS